MKQKTDHITANGQSMVPKLPEPVKVTPKPEAISEHPAEKQERTSAIYNKIWDRS
jgi:hypothetical protein